MTGKFRINESAEIIRRGNNDNVVLDMVAERAEYAQLEYEIFSHPDIFSQAVLQEKKKRFEELKTKYAKNSLLKNVMLNLKKCKEAGG